MEKLIWVAVDAPGANRPGSGPVAALGRRGWRDGRLVAGNVLFRRVLSLFQTVSEPTRLETIYNWFMSDGTQIWHGCPKSGRGRRVLSTVWCPFRLTSLMDSYKNHVNIFNNRMKIKPRTDLVKCSFGGSAQRRETGRKREENICHVLFPVALVGYRCCRYT